VTFEEDPRDDREHERDGDDVDSGEEPGRSSPES
jgi:hypothetical protein